MCEQDAQLWDSITGDPRDHEWDDYQYVPLFRPKNGRNGHLSKVKAKVFPNEQESLYHPPQFISSEACARKT